MFVAAAQRHDHVGPERHQQAGDAGRIEDEDQLEGAGKGLSGAEAYARIRAGASLVQLYSAMVYEGPGLGARIVKGLEALMRRDGFASIAEAVGSE